MENILKNRLFLRLLNLELPSFEKESKQRKLLQKDIIYGIFL